MYSTEVECSDVLWNVFAFINVENVDGKSRTGKSITVFVQKFTVATVGPPGRFHLPHLTLNVLRNVRPHRKLRSVIIISDYILRENIE